MKNKNTLIAAAVALVVIIGVWAWRSADRVAEAPVVSDVSTSTVAAEAAKPAPSSSKADEPAGLANLSYRLIGYKTASMPVGSNYTLTFRGSNGISAKLCNEMSGTYVESKGKLVAKLASTKMYCGEPAGLMDMESTFGAALAEGVTPTVQGNYLTLTDKSWNRFTFELVR